VQAIEADARAMQILGVDLALFASRVGEFEAAEDTNLFANLRNRLDHLQTNLAPAKQHDSAYLAELDSFRRAATHSLNKEFGQGMTWLRRSQMLGSPAPSVVGRQKYVRR